MTLRDLYALESTYYRGQPLASDSEDLQVIVELYKMLGAKQWLRFFKICEVQFSIRSEPYQKAFILNLAVTASEIIYDEQLRQSWIDRWSQIEGWGSCRYCKFVRTYQEGLTFFFRSCLREAESVLNQAHFLSESANDGQPYPLGGIRSLLHLGLVARDKKNSQKSHSLLIAAKEQALQIQMTALIERIEHHLSELSGNNLIESALLQKNFIEARVHWLRAEAQRRKAGFSRKAITLYRYLPLFNLLRGRPLKAARQIMKMDDPVVKMDVLKLKQKIFGLSATESAELQLMMSLYGVSQILMRTTNQSDIEIIGIKISQIKNDQIRRLIRYFIDNELPASKSDIAEKILDLNYDPTLHDGKIYKLIHRTKTIFGREDLFVNLYGSYVLNPIYRGDTMMIS